MNIVIIDKFDNSRESLQVIDFVDTDFFYLVTYRRYSDGKIITSCRSKSRYIVVSA